MDKRFINVALVLAVFGFTYAIIAASKKKNESDSKPVVTASPKASSSSANSSDNPVVAAPALANSDQSDSSSGSDTASAPANLQLEFAKIMQKVGGKLEQLDQLEIAQAVQAALQESLASKDFDKGIDTIRDGLQKLATTVASNLQICKTLQTKLSSVVDDVLSEFTKVVRSKQFSKITGDSYVAQIGTAVLKGIQAGLKKSKESPGKCPIHNGDLSKMMAKMSNSATSGGPVPAPPASGSTSAKPSIAQEAALQAAVQK